MSLCCDLCEARFTRKDEDVKTVMEVPGMCIYCPNGHILDRAMLVTAIRLGSHRVMSTPTKEK